MDAAMAVLLLVPFLLGSADLVVMLLVFSVVCDGERDTLEGKHISFLYVLIFMCIVIGTF